MTTQSTVNVTIAIFDMQETLSHEVVCLGEDGDDCCLDPTSLRTGGATLHAATSVASIRDPTTPQLSTLLSHPSPS